MKKNIYICLSFCVIIIFIICMIFYRLLPESDTYFLTNENGETIDVSVYVRTKNKNDELVLFFNNNEIKNTIIIVPKLKLIGLSEGGKREFTKINPIHSLWQKSKKANNYMIINNLINSDIINFYHFSEEKIEFNTFGEFEHFGKVIIVKKQS